MEEGSIRAPADVWDDSIEALINHAPGWPGTFNQESAVLFDLAELSSVEFELDALLRKSLSRIVDAFACRAGVLHCFDAYCPEQIIVEPPTDQVLCWPEILAVEKYLRSQIVDSRLQVLCTDLPPEALSSDGQPGQYWTVLAAVVQAGRKPIGVLSLCCDCGHLRTSEAVSQIKYACQVFGWVIAGGLNRLRRENDLVLKERQRLARDLHDSITQSLYGLAILGDLGKKQVEQADLPRLASTLNEINQYALQTLREMRLMLFELRPAELENGGFLQALRLRLERVECRAGMKVRLDLPGDLRIPEEIEVDLYHIVTEALNNALRHSAAREVVVSITETAGMLIVDVIDDGQGFEPDRILSGGHGLISMRERAQCLGGKLEINSQKGQGTRVHLEVRVHGRSGYGRSENLGSGGR